MAIAAFLESLLHTGTWYSNVVILGCYIAVFGGIPYTIYRMFKDNGLKAMIVEPGKNGFASKDELKKRPLWIVPLPKGKALVISLFWWYYEL